MYNIKQVFSRAHRWLLILPIALSQCLREEGTKDIDTDAKDDHV